MNDISITMNIISFNVIVGTWHGGNKVNILHFENICFYNFTT